MNNEIQKFDFKGAALRTLTDEAGEPWFVAKDVCDALGVATNHLREEGRGLDDDEVSTLPNWEGKGAAPLIISEAGLYSLVLKSRKPEAKRFKRWVTHEVRIAELEPKALFADAVSASDGTCLVGELAKMMTQAGYPIGQNRLFAKLREDGYLGKSGSNRNVPLQRYVEMGLFKIKETAITHADGHVTINRTPKCTGKGQRYFIEASATSSSATARRLPISNRTTGKEFACQTGFYSRAEGRRGRRTPSTPSSATSATPARFSAAGSPRAARAVAGRSPTRWRRACRLA